MEAADAVPWTKPAELAYGPECSLPARGGRFPDKFMVGFGDASVTVVDLTVSEEQVRAAVTRNGGEKAAPLVP